MTTVQKEAINIIGLAIRTSNHNGEAAKDIPGLWARFWAENRIAAIPNKMDDTIYCVYTNYEGDYTKPYTTLLGCRVGTLDEIPDEMVGHAIEPATYAVFTAKGNLMEGAVFAEWQKIWASGLQRAYTADFEVYGEKAQNPADAEVDIFIAV